LLEVGHEESVHRTIALLVIGDARTATIEVVARLEVDPDLSVTEVVLVVVTLDDAYSVEFEFGDLLELALV
jgi:hypothetical protein